MKRILIIALLLATASVAPLIFPIAKSGRSSMNVLAKVALLPAAVILLLTVSLLHRTHHPLAGIGTAMTLVVMGYHFQVVTRRLSKLKIPALPSTANHANLLADSGEQT